MGFVEVGRRAPSADRPISSSASRRAVIHGVSLSESALPPGSAACPASVESERLLSQGGILSSHTVSQLGTSDSQYNP